MDPNLAAVLQAVVGVIALGACLLGFVTGTRVSVSGTSFDMPPILFIVGLTVGIGSVYALSLGAPYVVTAGAFSAAFLIGISVGLSTTKRP